MPPDVASADGLLPEYVIAVSGAADDFAVQGKRRINTAFRQFMPVAMAELVPDTPMAQSVAAAMGHGRLAVTDTRAIGHWDLLRDRVARPADIEMPPQSIVGWVDVAQGRILPNSFTAHDQYTPDGNGPPGSVPSIFAEGCLRIARARNGRR